MTFSDQLRQDEPARHWFGVGSYVDVQHRVLYVETAKAASTSIKMFLKQMTTHRPLSFNPALAETRMEMFIHDRSQSPLLSLLDFPPQQIDEIVTAKEWFRFCVVRHPIDRFFAAWRDKIFLCEPDFIRYAPTDGRKYVDLNDFIQTVVNTEAPETCNIHWRAQSALLRPTDINYTYIYDIGAIADLPGHMAAHLANIRSPTRVPPLARFNEGLPIKSDGLLTAAAVAALRRFYDADFRCFCFPEFEAAGVPPVSAASLVSAFTDAIFDRNRIIAAHALRV